MAPIVTHLYRDKIRFSLVQKLVLILCDENTVEGTKEYTPNLCYLLSVAQSYYEGEFL